MTASRYADDLPAVAHRPILSVPARRSHWVERPRLLSPLAARPSLVVVSAPRGWGKTTLLTQWVRQRSAAGWAFVWMNVADATRRSAQTDLTAQISTALTIATRRPVVLVLDEVDPRALAELEPLIDRLLHHPPPNLIVALAVSDGVVAPETVGMTGAIVWLEASDLAFTEGETRQVLRRILGGDLPGDKVQRLLARTEGWPAAVVAAASTLEAASTADLDSAEPALREYVRAAVLDQLDEQLHTFARRIAILGAFDHDACLAADALPGGDACLHRALARRLVVRSDGGSGDGYRLHPLVRDALRATTPDDDIEAAVLHRRAAECHEAAGRTDEALWHAVQAGDHRIVIRLGPDHWLGQLRHGRIGEAAASLELCSDATLAIDPAHALAAASLACAEGDPPTFQRWLSPSTDADLERPGGGFASLRSGRLVLRAFGSYEPLDRLLAELEAAIPAEATAGTPGEASLRLALAWNGFLRGQPSHHLFAAAADAAADQALVRSGALAGAALSLLGTRAGRAQAQRSAGAALSDLRALGLVDHPVAWLANLVAGVTTPATPDGLALVEHAVHLASSFDAISPWPGIVARTEFTQVQLARGDRSMATPALAEAQALQRRYGRRDSRYAAELDRLSARLAAMPPEFGVPLTARERQVGRFLRSRLTSREIAQALGVSHNTVRSQVRVIYRKLGATSRDEAVAIATTRGDL